MKKLRICLIMFGAPFDTITARLEGRIKLFAEISDSLYLLIDKKPSIEILDDNVQVIDLNMEMPSKKSTRSLLFLILKLEVFIRIQLHMAYNFYKIRKDIDVVIFSAGIPFILHIMFLAKFMGKKVLVTAGGSPSIGFKASNPNKFALFHLIRLMEKCCYYLATSIAVETESTINFMELDKFKNKISIFKSLIYIDTNIFKVNSQLEDRDTIVGYIGSLVAGKGVLNFVEAANSILEQKKDTKFIIGGKGELLDKINYELEKNDLVDMVKLVGWIPPHEVPSNLNKLKLLVLPSYSEGLPGIILEAMACGTPVLATSVGGIPDVITDGTTGFLMENNSSECIEKNVLRVLNHPNLDKIVINARTLIENDFAFEPSLERYKQIFENI